MTNSIWFENKHAVYDDRKDPVLILKLMPVSYQLVSYTRDHVLSHELVVKCIILFTLALK